MECWQSDRGGDTSVEGELSADAEEDEEARSAECPVETAKGEGMTPVSGETTEDDDWDSVGKSSDEVETQSGDTTDGCGEASVAVE